jgi:hypothetical protein
VHAIDWVPGGPSQSKDGPKSYAGAMSRQLLLGAAMAEPAGSTRLPQTS